MPISDVSSEVIRGFYIVRLALERSSWQGWYVLMILQILRSNMNYQLVRYFPDFPGASYKERFFIILVLMDSPSFQLAFSGGRLIFTWST